MFILAAFQVYLVARIQVPSELMHILFFSLLGLGVFGAWQLSLPAAFALANSVSFLDECLQGLHPQRVFDFQDLVLNGLSITFGIGLSLAFRIKLWGLGTESSLQVLEGRDL
jgi:hypothetical protein